MEAGLRSLAGVPGPGPRSHLEGAQGEELNLEEEKLKLEEEEQKQQEGEEGLQGPGGRLATGPFLQLEDREAGEAWGELSSLAPSCPGPAWR